MSASDFRSDPSPSPEGGGRARQAWDAYARTVKPAIEPMAKVMAQRWTSDMIGFYVLWHAYGGFEGLEQNYGMHRSTIWRKVAKFRKTFGVHPDEFRMPGVTIDGPSFWNAALKDAERRKG